MRGHKSASVDGILINIMYLLEVATFDVMNAAPRRA